MKYKHKLPWQQIIFTRQYSSSSNQKKNHYDNLEISTSATHNEVKSAFFKLSKLYHPDKNSSEKAKHMFRNISEAYEVLGNHDKRKQYDRQLRIINPTSSNAPSATADYPIYRDQTQVFTQAELRKEAERVRSTYARHSSETDTPYHDMDAWTKEHYSDLFEKTMLRKKKIRNLKSNQRHDKEVEQIIEREGRPVVIILVMLMTLFILEEYFAHPPDTAINLVNKTNTDKKNQQD